LGQSNAPKRLFDRPGLSTFWRNDNIAVFPILADPVDVKKGDQQCETVSQPSIQPDKVDWPMGS